MNRIHIHFAPGEPGEKEVISGMRNSAEIYIYVDIAKALKGTTVHYYDLNLKCTFLQMLLVGNLNEM